MSLLSRYPSFRFKTVQEWLLTQQTTTTTKTKTKPATFDGQLMLIYFSIFKFLFLFICSFIHFFFIVLIFYWFFLSFSLFCCCFFSYSWPFSYSFVGDNPASHSDFTSIKIGRFVDNSTQTQNVKISSCSCTMHAAILDSRLIRLWRDRDHFLTSADWENFYANMKWETPNLEYFSALFWASILQINLSC